MLDLISVGKGAGIIARSGALIARILRPFDGELTDEWWQHIEADGAEPAKRDIVRCRHRFGKVFGTISRVDPEEEHLRRWKFAGHVFDHCIVAIFWSVRATSELSFGVIRLDLTERNTFKGCYYKRRVAHRSIHKSADDWVEVPMSWKRR